MKQTFFGARESPPVTMRRVAEPISRRSFFIARHQPMSCSRSKWTSSTLPPWRGPSHRGPRRNGHAPRAPPLWQPTPTPRPRAPPSPRPRSAWPCSGRNSSMITWAACTRGKYHRPSAGPSNGRADKSRPSCPQPWPTRPPPSQMFAPSPPPLPHKHQKA